MPDVLPARDALPGVREGASAERAEGGLVSRVVLARRTYRIGVQTVEVARDGRGERWFVTIRNRSYASEHEVPEAAGRRWLAALEAGR